MLIWSRPLRGYKQETEATVHRGSTKLDNRRLKNVARSDESRFLLQRSDGRVRTVVSNIIAESVVQAGGGVMVFEMHRLNTTWVSPTSILLWPQRSVPPHEAQTVSYWFLEHDSDCTHMTSTFTRSPSPEPGTVDSHHRRVVRTLCLYSAFCNKAWITIEEIIARLFKMFWSDDTRYFSSCECAHVNAAGLVPFTFQNINITSAYL